MNHMGRRYAVTVQTVVGSYYGVATRSEPKYIKLDGEGNMCLTTNQEEAEAFYGFRSAQALAEKWVSEKWNKTMGESHKPNVDVVAIQRKVKIYHPW